MAIFWTSWLVATNMTPFAMTFHNWLQAAERLRETSCLCAKTVVTVSRLVLLSAGLFALYCGSGRLQTCCFSLFSSQLCLLLNQKPPFAPREVTRCRLLSLLQSSGSASFTCFVSLLSALLFLSCALIRKHFVSFSARERSVFYLHRFFLILSLFVLRVLCCPCWGTSHFFTFASDHGNGKYASSFSVFAVFRRLRLCYTVCFCSL